MKWFNSHKNPPKVNEKVYYFGPNIGIGIGYYDFVENRSFNPYYYDDNGVKVYEEKEINLCPHTFINANWGVVDACDAPFWLPYDEERAKSWCPIIPDKYTKDLYE